MASVTSFTYTGKAGPAQTITTKVYSGVTSFLVDVVNQTLTLFGTLPNNEPLVLDLNPLTTVTATLTGAGGNWTVSMT